MPALLLLTAAILYLPQVEPDRPAAIADVLPLARDFAASSHAPKGGTGAGCHLPELLREPAADPATGVATRSKRIGRSHLLLGTGDAGRCAEAFGFLLRRDCDRLRRLLRNSAGHPVPGTRRRSLPMTFRQRDDKGRQLHERKFVVSSDNPLLVDEGRQLDCRCWPARRCSRSPSTTSTPARRPPA